MISPPIIFLYCKGKRKIAYSILILLTTLSVICNGVFTYAFDFGINASGNEKYSNLLYSKPWTRFAPYGFGAIVGLLYFEYRTKKDQFDEAFGNKFYDWASRVNRLGRVVIFMAGASIILFIILIPTSYFSS